MVNGLLGELELPERKWYTSLAWSLGLAACVASRLLPAASVSGICDIAGCPQICSLLAFFFAISLKIRVKFGSNMIKHILH